MRYFWLFLSLLMVSGCAALGWSEAPVEQIPVQISTHGDQYFSILEAKAKLKGDELVISGRVRKLYNVDLPKTYDPRIKVTALGPDGEIIRSGSTKFLPLGMRRREKDFTIRLPNVSKGGTQVIVSYDPSES